MPGVVVPDETIHLKYQGYDHFCKVVSHQYNLLRKGESVQQYLEFSEVSRSEFETLSSDQTRPRKSIRYSYDNRTRILLVKLMPGPDHEVTIGVFREMVNDELAAMRVKHECLIQSSPETHLGNWTKEPDTSWGPKATGNLQFVLEVGVSESAQRLAIDARGWLETPGTTVRTVVTISLGNYDDDNVIEKPITIGVYNAYPTGSRNMSHSAFQTVSITISRPPGATMPTLSGVLKDPVTQAETLTDEIRLSFEMFVGRSPNGGSEGDIILTKNLLLEFAEDVWGQQRLRRQKKLKDGKRYWLASLARLQ